MNRRLVVACIFDWHCVVPGRSNHANVPAGGKQDCFRGGSKDTVHERQLGEDCPSVPLSDTKRPDSPSAEQLVRAVPIDGSPVQFVRW